MTDGLVMFSGGLDSVVTAHVLKSQGLSIKAVHFVLPFHSGIGYEHKAVRSYAEALGVPLIIVEEGEEYIEMIRDPHFGFGKNANPCVDCRIHRLTKAKKIMESEGASFIATGEVVGQRPMSQRLECLASIEERSGLKGLLIRPLSAKLLEPTIPEVKGIINRNALFDFYGRSRKRQLAYAEKHGLIHSTPAGGCILTNEETAKRFIELSSLKPQFTLTDFKLLAFGRHFRLDSGAKLVIARTDAENFIIEKLVGSDGVILDMAQIPGPLGVITGDFSDKEVTLAASMIARYSKARLHDKVAVKVYTKGVESILDVKPADEQVCSEYIVCKK